MKSIEVKIIMSFNKHPVLTELSILGFVVSAVHVLYYTAGPNIIMTLQGHIWFVEQSLTPCETDNDSPWREKPRAEVSALRVFPAAPTWAMASMEATP